MRRLWESQGVQVSRLIRIRFGPVALPNDLRAGRFRDLSAAETAALYAAVGLKAAPARRRRRPGPRHGRRVR